MRLKLPWIKRVKKLVDACIFFNEIDLLTVRFEELWNHVDHFVVIEADTTHSGRRKPFFIPEYRAQLKPYQDKVIYGTTTLSLITGEGEEVRFLREATHRNAITAAIAELTLSPGDTVLVSDVDEIPRARHLDQLDRLLDEYDYVIFMLKNFRGYINNISSTALNGVIFAGTVACRVGTLLRGGAHAVRRGDNKSGGVKMSRSADYAYIDDGGWHLSSLGGPEAFWLKAASFIHIEDPYRVIRLGDTVPAPQVFSAATNREQCRAGQKKYLAYCPSPAFSPLAFDTFEVSQDVPVHILTHKERFRRYFFFTDLDRRTVDAR
jgi:beta-1,4-mannosyl-glycoprotein beta-1,4-N-acetylglucosaminyltransferase